MSLAVGELADSLVPVAVELVGTVRDYGPETVAAVLQSVPDGRYDALAVVLAAMVDPDKTPKQLLGWLETPVQSRRFEPTPDRGGRKQHPREHGTDRGYQQHRHRNDMPACEPCKAAHREHAASKKMRSQECLTADTGDSRSTS